jgi:hypothetical protein
MYLLAKRRLIFPIFILKKAYSLYLSHRVCYPEKDAAFSMLLYSVKCLFSSTARMSFLPIKVHIFCMICKLCSL